MKINEAEQEVGIARKNIRFYEQQGLLSPSRNLSNGYREYSSEDILILRRIKLLRKLGIPIEEIRKLQSHYLTLDDCLHRHLIILERESKNLDTMQMFCRNLLNKDISLETMDVEQLLNDMENIEEGGTRCDFYLIYADIFRFYTMDFHNEQRYAPSGSDHFLRKPAYLYRGHTAGIKRTFKRN